MGHKVWLAAVGQNLTRAATPTKGGSHVTPLKILPVLRSSKMGKVKGRVTRYKLRHSAYL